MTATTAIRPLTAADEADWRRLWTGYLEYYETSVPDEVYRTTFGRLLGDDPHDYHGLVAVQGGRLVGLTHYLFHRGTGAGRALIEAVYAAGDAAGCPSVYWMTQDFNATARRLYDRVGKLTPFIKYQR